MRIRIPARLPVLVACAAALLAGCAQPWQQVQAGQDESAIVARMGPPREIYDLPGGGKRLMWPTQPMGEVTVAADVDAAHRIVNVRQVLQPSEFYRAEIGKWTKTDVLVNFGRPVETSYFPLMKREVRPGALPGLSAEVRDIFGRVRPATLHAAARTPGVRPSTLLSLF